MAVGEEGVGSRPIPQLLGCCQIDLPFLHLLKDQPLHQVPHWLCMHIDGQ